MKAKKMMVMAVLVAFALTLGGEAFARGPGAGGGNGQGGSSSGGASGSSSGGASGGTSGGTSGGQSGAQSGTQSGIHEGAQRRDGSFLGTGTTANGSTTRPANGRGVMDGTGVNQP